MGTDQEPQNLPFPLSYSHSGFYDEHCAKHDTKLIWKIVDTPLRITVYPAWQKLAVYVEVWLHKSGECARGLSITLKEYSCRSSLCLLYKVCCIQAVLSHIFLLPCSMFSFFVGAFIFLREHCRAWSLCPLSYVFCNVPPPPLSLTFSHFLLMAVVLLPLPLFSITLLLSHSRSVPSVLVLSHGPWPPIMTPAAVTLVHSTVYLVEVSAEATNMSCKLFLFSQHKSTCVWIDPVACKSSISLGVCAYMVDPVAW